MPKFTNKYRPDLSYDDDVPSFIRAFTIAVNSNQLPSEDHVNIVNHLDIFEEKYELYLIRKRKHDEERAALTEYQKSVRASEQVVQKITPPEYRNLNG